jgi:AcrR family transcriptional regulator
MTRAGNDRRGAVLDRAVHLASVEGLEGLTLGRLAADLGTSKSGLQTLFGTKQDLQLAIVAAAQEVFTERVLRPAERFDDGLPRLRALLDGWIDYLDTFEGGCLFTAAASEFDGRPGPVRDVVAQLAAEGEELLLRQARLAVRLGELAVDTDVDQLVFELHATTLQANLERQLLGRADAYDRARRAVARLLDHAGR